MTEEGGGGGKKRPLSRTDGSNDAEKEGDPKRRKIEVIDLSNEDEDDENQDVGSIEEPSGSDSEDEEEDECQLLTECTDRNDGIDSGDDEQDLDDGTHPDDAPNDDNNAPPEEDTPDIPDPEEKQEKKDDKLGEDPSVAKGGGGLFCGVRPAGPFVLTLKQQESVEMMVDMAEHGFDLEVLELIQLGAEFLKHGYDCCHPDCAGLEKTVFKCSDCGMVAETKPRQWDEIVDDLLSKRDRIAKLIQTYLAKPPNPLFK